MAQEEVTLERSLDNAANVLRSKMDANEYKNYTLGTIFYKYLSDSMLYYVAELLEEKNISLEEAQKLYEENQDDQYLIEELDIKFNYVIEAKNTYTNILKSINNHTFQVSQLGDAFNSIESQGKEFEGLFDDYDLYSKRLGNTAQKQSDTISEVLSAIGKLEIVKTPEDTLGNAYEYLIKQFASESGKKAGEFYTPQKVSRLLARLTLVDKDYTDGMTVYDPTMGSGSLLLNFRKYVEHSERITYFGQEINTSTYNLARMNMILHHVDVVNQKLRNNDTLDEDWPVEEITNFDAVVMNPPYSHKWSANAGFKDDPRFSAYGVLPPKSKADYAFLLHEDHLQFLHSFKSFLLQKMFFDNDIPPLLRFNKFTEKWNQCKLNDHTIVTMGQSPNSKNYTNNQTGKILVQGNADLYKNKILKRVFTTEVTKTAVKNDILISVRAPVGDIARNQYESVVIGRGIASIKGNDFLYYQLEKMKNNGFWNKYIAGSTFESITGKDLKNTKIYTTNSDEERKIGNIFSSLTKIIQLQEHKIDSLKKLKQFLLQNMFI